MKIQIPQDLPQKSNIFNKIDQLAPFGTKPKIDPFCGLARGNAQFLDVLGLSREPEISRSNIYGFESAIYIL
jgi:hypothetical protein